MKRVLLDNALEAWAMAIKYCNYLLEGIATLPFQKHFVSSLHNAVELFMKQMMIDTGNHDVAYIPKKRIAGNIQLETKFRQETDLNAFFAERLEKELDMFYSIGFKDLIDNHLSIIKNGLGNCSLKPELELLQELRNRETHFMIDKSSFLSDEDFKVLHNFMIAFCNIILDSGYLPLFGEPTGEDKRFVFDKTPLTLFSYETALMQSSLTLKVRKALDGSYEYGSPGCSAYHIAFLLCKKEKELANQIEIVWPIVEMLFRYEMISYEEEVEEIPEEIDPYGKNVHYKLLIKQPSTAKTE